MTSSPFTAHQVRLVCSLLRWGSAQIVQRTGVSYETARRVREDENIATIADIELRAIRTALRKAGVRFTADGKGRLGAKRQVTPSR